MIFFKLSAFYFFYFAALGVYVIFLPQILVDIGYSKFDVGMLLAIAPLMRFAVPFLFLKYLRLDKNLLKISVIISLISSILFYKTIFNFYAFALNNIVLGVCLSIVLPYIETIAIRVLGKSKYGKSRLYGSIGFMLIALVLANFLSSVNIVINYYLALIFCTAIFSFLLIKYDISYDNIDNTNKKSSFSLMKYWPFWVSLFLMQVGFGAYYNFFTVYELEYNISIEMTSYLWSFGVICEILILYFQAPLLKNNLLTIIKFCIFITSIRWFLLYMFPSNLYITFFSQSFHAFSFALYHSAILLALYSLYKDKKLAQQFMFGVAYGLGGFMGAFISGWFYGKNLFLYDSMITLLAFITLFFLKNRRKYIKNR